MSLLVKDVMTKNMIKIESSVPVKKAAELMDKYDIGYTCQKRRDFRKLTAIVSFPSRVSTIILTLDSKLTKANYGSR